MSCKNVLFLGMGLDSPNRGVNALCIGATEVVKHAYPSLEEITLVGFKKNVSIREYTLTTANGNVKVINKFYSKKELLVALIEASLFKLFGLFPKSSLSRDIFGSDLVFDLNEGDSFSDIYGSHRILRHFMDSFLAILYKKDLIFLPQTIGPFSTFFGKKLGLFILKHLHKLYVRDNKAKEFLKSNNVPFSQTIDLAVYMKPKKVDIELPSEFVAINVNGLMYFNNYESLKNQFEQYKETLVEIVNFFISKDKTILFVPHTYDATNPVKEDDLEAIRQIMQQHNFKKVSFIDKDYDAQELKYIISKADFFIGSRMHSCVAGLSTSVPTVGLSYSYKFKGTFSMFDSENTVLEVNNLPKEEIIHLVQKIKTIYEQKEQIKTKLNKMNNREMLKI